MQNTDCTYICEQYTEYQGNTLPPEIRAKVDTHLASCSSCNEIFREINSVLETLHHLPALQASAHFTSSLLTRIDTDKQPGTWQKIYHSSYLKIAGYAIAAGLVLAIGINILIDPISPLRFNGRSDFAGEQPHQIQAEEQPAGLTDSASNSSADTLILQNIPINSQNQSMRLVSGKK